MGAELPGHGEAGGGRTAGPCGGGTSQGGVYRTAGQICAHREEPAGGGTL